MSHLPELGRFTVCGSEQTLHVSFEDSLRLSVLCRRCKWNLSVVDIKEALLTHMLQLLTIYVLLSPMAGYAYGLLFPLDCNL